jgi:hypothetical protein
MNEGRQGGHGDFFCPHCEDYVDSDLLVFLSHTDRHIIDAIKKQFPDWVESDGACPK